MNKPLHKDPSFWIVAVVSLGFAVWGQWTVAVPWVTTRLREMKPAERMPVPEEATLPNGRQRRPGFDYSKKTYSWQTPEHDWEAFQSAEPQVVIIPSEYTGSGGGGWSMPMGDKAVGVRVGAQQILAAAYGWNRGNRVVFPPDFDKSLAYDYIANLKEGAMDALKKEAESKLGLTAEKMFIKTNAYVLVVALTNAPGLRPGSDPGGRLERKPGFNTLFRLPAEIIAMNVEFFADAPILDQTGLTGQFDVDWPADMPTSKGSERVEAVRNRILESLGLDLIATNAPVEFLVVRKTPSTR